MLPYDDIEVLKKPFELISETAQTVMRFSADKLVYIDFNDLIFANLYISKDPKDTQSKYSTLIILNAS